LDITIFICQSKAGINPLVSKLIYQHSQGGILMKVQLVTDSASDIPKALIDKYNIEVVPLNIIFDNQSYKDQIEIDTHTFYEMMSRNKELPKTSQPTPQAFAEAFRKAHVRGPVLCITLSSGLSGTYQSALLAKKMVDFEVEIIDSLTASIGIGLLVVEACELAEKGYNLHEIKTKILEYRQELKTYFTLNTLENAVKGGRVAKWEGSIAQILSIKPVMSFLPDGSVGNQEKISGRKRAIKRIIQLIENLSKDCTNRRLGIAHAMVEEEVEYIVKELKRIIQPKEIIVTRLGPVLGTHGGFGTIGVVI
jgi:DegV family protein with EDD domain